MSPEFVGGHRLNSPTRRPVGESRFAVPQCLPMMGILGDVAQLAERFVRNEEVVGSTPIVSTP